MPVSAYINLKLSLSLILAMMLNLTSNLSLALRSSQTLDSNIPPEKHRRFHLFQQHACASTDVADGVTFVSEQFDASDGQS